MLPLKNTSCNNFTKYHQNKIPSCNTIKNLTIPLCLTCLCVYIHTDNDVYCKHETILYIYIIFYSANIYSIYYQSDILYIENIIHLQYIYCFNILNLYLTSKNNFQLRNSFSFCRFSEVWYKYLLHSYLM